MQYCYRSMACLWEGPPRGPRSHDSKGVLMWGTEDKRFQACGGSPSRIGQVVFTVLRIQLCTNVASRRARRGGPGTGCTRFVLATVLINRRHKAVTLLHNGLQLFFILLTYTTCVKVCVCVSVCACVCVCASVRVCECVSV